MQLGWASFWSLHWLSEDGQPVARLIDFGASTNPRIDEPDLIANRRAVMRPAEPTVEWAVRQASLESTRVRSGRRARPCRGLQNRGTRLRRESWFEKVVSREKESGAGCLNGTAGLSGLKSIFWWGVTRPSGAGLSERPAPWASGNGVKESPAARELIRERGELSLRQRRLGYGMRVMSESVRVRVRDRSAG